MSGFAFRGENVIGCVALRLWLGSVVFFALQEYVDKCEKPIDRLAYAAPGFEQASSVPACVGPSTFLVGRTSFAQPNLHQTQVCRGEIGHMWHTYALVHT